MYIRQKNWLKYTDCAELRKIAITNCLFFFFQTLQISLLFVLFDWKKLKLTVQVSCLFYFSLLRSFFKEKIEWIFLIGFIVFFKWDFSKKTGVFLGSGFFYNNPGSVRSSPYWGSDKGAIEGLALFVPAWHIVLPTAMWDTLFSRRK